MRILVLILGLAACAPEPEHASPAALPAARAVMGRPTDGPHGLVGDDLRALGWRVAQRVLEGDVPRFVTWYDRADVLRMFGKLYGDLGKDGRRVRAPLSAASIDAAEHWNASMVLTLPGWTPERLADWELKTRTFSRRVGLSGLSRTLYSPSAGRHLLQSYTSVAEGVTSPFPSAAAVVKTAWRRADFDMALPVYRTDPASLEAHRAADSWGSGDAAARPGPGEIVTMTNEAGDAYRLAALHVMTKEQDDWVWVTLWWSDRPDEDFGADRPAALATGPWRSYKMCAVTRFADTWCSNPYLEAGPGNQRTNCLGCHQHAGTAVEPRDVPQDEARFPENGRRKTRDTFPADYLWSLSRDPERLGEGFQSLIRHYDVYDPLEP